MTCSLELGTPFCGTETVQCSEVTAICIRVGQISKKGEHISHSGVGNMNLNEHEDLSISTGKIAETTDNTACNDLAEK